MAAAELAGTRGDRGVRRTLRAESRRRAYAGRHPPGSRPAGNRRIRDRAAIAPEFSRKESPAVAITAHPKPEAARLAEDTGFDRFLVKPLGLAQLDEVLVSAAARREAAGGEGRRR